jgi:protein O-mannosyl-transferase
MTPLPAPNHEVPSSSPTATASPSSSLAIDPDLSLRARYVRLVALLLVVLAFAAYFNSLTVPFLFDDEPNIIGDAGIQNFYASIPGLLQGRRGMVRISLALNYAIDKQVAAWQGEPEGGLNPAGYHLMNILIHATAGLALFGLVRRTLELPKVPEGLRGSSVALSGIVAAIWIAHPLNSQAVTYTIQRTESLMGMFYLLTLYCLVRHAIVPAGRMAWPWGALAILFCSLGMATKEVMVTAPAMALLLELSVLSRLGASSWKRRWWVVPALFLTWGIMYKQGVNDLIMTAPSTQPADGIVPATAAEHLPGPAVEGPSAGLSVTFIKPWEYALTQAGVVLHYLRLSFWPDRLAMDYGWPVTRTIIKGLPDLLGIGAVGISSLVLWWRRPALGVLMAAFFLILSPTSSFVPIVDMVFEHRMYLPLAALVTLAVLLVHLGLRRIEAPAWAGPALVAVVLALLLTRTIVRNNDYRTAEALWRANLDVRPMNPRVYHNLGGVIAAADPARLPEAMALYEIALKLVPDFAEAKNNLGALWVDQGRLDKAMPLLLDAVKVKPRDAEVQYNLGRAYLLGNDLPHAIEHLQLAINLRPNYAKAMNNLGIAMAKSGRYRDAVDAFGNAVALMPKQLDMRGNLATALLSSGRPAEAADEFRKCREIDPVDVTYSAKLSGALLASGDVDGATREIAAAMAINQRHPEVQMNLGTIAYAKGQPTAAITQLSMAMSARPGHPETARRIAWIRATSSDASVRNAEEAVRMAEYARRAGGGSASAYLDTLRRTRARGDGSWRSHWRAKR